MTNEQLPREVWIFNNDAWRESWNYEETEILAHFKKAYDTKIHDHMESYILASRVEKMIQIAVLKESVNIMYSSGDHPKGMDSLYDSMMIEINQLKEELK